MKKFLLSTLLFAFAFSAVAQEKIDLMQVIPNDPQVRTGVLESGIRYYIRHNAKDPQRANFHIVYDVGAVQEDDNQNGLAHFLEHMAFNGSKNFQGNALIDYLQSIGVRFGENLNAGTGQEQTTYMITNVPITRQSIIDSALLVLHDWAGFINLDAKDIDEERGVIREEWRQGTSAAFRIQEKQSPALFNNSIYAKRNVIGSEEVLKSFTYDDLRSFYRKWYRPDMQAFVIVGDFDVDMMEAKLKATMADIKAADVRTPKAKVEVADNEQPLISIDTDPEQATTDISILFRHIPMAEKYNDRVMKEKNDIITSLISTMINNRLNEITKQENAPFMQAGGSYFAFVDPFDAFYVSGRSKNGESLKAFEAIYTELLRMQRGGFVTSEFDRAKADMLSSQENAYKNRNDRRNGQFINLYMSNFTKNTPYPTPEYELELVKTLLDQTTLAEVNAVAKSLVRDQNSAIMIASPEKVTIPTKEDINAAMTKVKASDIALYVDNVKNEPLVDQSKLKPGKVIDTKEGKFGSTVWTLSNEVRVVVKPTDLKADEVVLSMVQPGGYSTIADLKDLASIKFYPYMASNAGLGNFTASELDKALSGKIAYAQLVVDDISQGIAGSCSPKDLETMIQLAYLRITAPRLEQADLNVTTNQWRAVLTNLEKTPDYIFSDSLIMTTSAGNPRALVDLPSLKGLDNVSLDRMIATYKKLTSNATDMTFIFTGSVNLDELKPLVEKYLGSLPAAKNDASWGKYVVSPAKGEVTNKFKTPMETPKVTAAVFYTGKMDYTPNQVVNMDAIKHILTIRYTKAIREEAGGTYGVGVSCAMAKYPDPEFTVAINFNTDASKIDELLPIVYKEINDMMANGVSDENLKITKEFFAKKFKENNNLNSIWSRYIRDWYLSGTDSYSEYLKNVESLTSDSIREAARKAFSQKNIVTVVQLP